MVNVSPTFKQILRKYWFVAEFDFLQLAPDSGPACLETDRELRDRSRGPGSVTGSAAARSVISGVAGTK